MRYLVHLFAAVSCALAAGASAHDANLTWFWVDSALAVVNTAIVALRLVSYRA